MDKDKINVKICDSLEDCALPYTNFLKFNEPIDITLEISYDIHPSFEENKIYTINGHEFLYKNEKFYLVSKQIVSINFEDKNDNP